MPTRRTLFPILLAGGAAVLSERFSHAAPSEVTRFAQLKIGAGGFITGLDIAPDGTMVIRTDTFGAYRWNGTSWNQLFTPATLARSEYGHDANGNWKNTEGVYEIVIAPSDSSRMYAMLRGKVYHTSTGGSSWIKSSGWRTIVSPEINANPNEQGSPGRISASRMAVDPVNKDICYVGAYNGLWKTVDGGVTWAQISRASIPAPTTASGGMLVCFDDTSPHPGTPNVSQIIYASSYGNGVFRSADGGSSWTLTTSSPTTHLKMICRNGVVWHIDNHGGNFLRSYNGTWSAVYMVGGSQNGRCSAVDIDPANSARIIVLGDGGFHSISMNAGKSFTGWGGFTTVRAAGPGEPQWLCWTNENFMSCGNIRFHPTNSNELWFAEGIGPWLTKPGDTTTPYTWNVKARGIEQLVANGVISPPGGAPLVHSWDRPIFRVADATTYPATHGPNNRFPIVMGSSADWASSDPTCIVLLANFGGGNVSGKSNDGGQNWTTFATSPANTSTTDLGGCIAASTNQNFVWAPAQNKLALWYTINGGSTWSAANIPGPVTTGWSNSYAINRQILCADRVNANTFYLYYNGTQNSDGAGNHADGAIAGIYRSKDGGANWTKVYAGRMNGNNNLGFNQSFWAAKLRAVPKLGSTSTAGHLFFTAGDVGGTVAGALSRSTDGGVNWSAVNNVLEAIDVGFGAPAPGQAYPAIYIAGWVGGSSEFCYGIWRSIDNCGSWTRLTDYPGGNFDCVKCISGDSNTYGNVYVGFLGSGWAYGSV